MQTVHPWRREGAVPAVDPADLKTAWNLVYQTKKERPGVIAIGRGLWEQVLSPGADVDAITFRAAMLDLIFKHHAAELGNLQPTDAAVLSVMSDFPLRWLQPGGKPPFDPHKFISRLHNPSAA